MSVDEKLDRSQRTEGGGGGGGREEGKGGGARTSDRVRDHAPRCVGGYGITRH